MIKGRIRPWILLDVVARIIVSSMFECCVLLQFVVFACILQCFLYLNVFCGWVFSNVLRLLNVFQCKRKWRMSQHVKENPKLRRHLQNFRKFQATKKKMISNLRLTEFPRFLRKQKLLRRRLTSWKLMVNGLTWSPCVGLLALRNFGLFPRTICHRRISTATFEVVME